MTQELGQDWQKWKKNANLILRKRLKKWKNVLRETERKMCDSIIQAVHNFFLTKFQNVFETKHRNFVTKYNKKE